MTKRWWRRRGRSPPPAPARPRPAPRATSASRSTRPTAAAKGTADLSGSTSPAPPTVSGTAATPYATMGTPWPMASARGTQKPSWSEAITKTSAARKYASSSAPLTEPASVHDVGQPELVDEGTQRRLVGLAERRPDEMQAGRRVVGPAEHVEHLDEVVRRLVRRDLPHVEQVAPRPRAPCGGARNCASCRIGLVALGLHVDQQRDDGRPLVPERVQFRLVEGGVGHGEAALRGQAGQLRAAQRGLVGHRRLPVAQQVGRRDVVVVHQLGLGPRRQDVVHGAPDGRLIQQPAVTAGPAELDHRLALGLHVGRGAAVEDVRVDAGGAQAVPQVQRVHADGVTAGEGRNDLIDPHGRAVYRRALHPDCALAMHQFAAGRAGSLGASCWSEPHVARRSSRRRRDRRRCGALLLSLAVAVPTALLGLASPAAADLDAPDRASVPAESNRPRRARPPG